MNPGNALCAIVAGLKDAEGRITVPGFYDRVRPLTAEERARVQAAVPDEKAFIAESGSPRPWGEVGFNTAERVTVRPTLDVNGLWGGYSGEGSKTVLPARFGAKVSMRIVPDQDPADIFQRFTAHVQALAPPGVQVKVTDLHSATPWITEPDHPMLEAARRALSRSWAKPPVMIREGGSIPVMATFQQVFGYPAILMGFGLDDDRVHSPNEKFTLASFHGGTRSVAYLYEELARAR
jgi:acetylornithine deacetylase/succinyl-diaminopimelate desuccinylase-like protein